MTDTSRPIEYRTYNGEQLRVIQPLNGMTMRAVHPHSRMAPNYSLNERALDFDPRGIPRLSDPTTGAPTQEYAQLRPESNLAFYRVFFADTLYDMEYRVRYVVPHGQENRGMQGTLTFWVYDSWTRNSVVEEKSYRCQMHAVDMRKYGPGTPVSGNTYEIKIDERFLVPRDCGNESGTALASQTAVARRLGIDLVTFRTRYTRHSTTVAASYGIDNEVILLKDTTDAEKKANCAPNPSDFFYDTTAQAVDRFKYLEQRRIPFQFVTTLADSGSTLVPDIAWFRETTQTNLGVSDVRPKKLVQKIRSVGPARGYLRADVDWYLAGDRHKYWQTFGLTSEREAAMAFLEAFLIPLDENDQPMAAGVDGYPNIGKLRVTRASAHGVTYTANYPITEALRQQFMNPASPLATTREGKKFLIRACMRFGGADPTSERTANHEVYSVRLHDRCQTSATPMVIRLDPSVAPLDPLESDAFSEAMPAGAGDNRMSQAFDNDMENECVDGTSECRTIVSNGLEGSGAFGGSVLHGEMSARTAADGSNKVFAQKDVEILGFSVIEDEEEEYPALSTSGPEPTVTFTLNPPWEDIVPQMNRALPALRWEHDFSAGQQGLAVGWVYTAPVRYGPVQGDITFSFTVGFGAGATFTYTFGGDVATGCTGSAEECETLYVLQPAQPLREALKACYRKGGRLADMTSAVETQFLRGKIPANGRVWLGGQVANEYLNPQCLNAWDNSRCSAGHQTHLRWLSNDMDFATATSFGPFTVDSGEINFGGTSTTLSGISSRRPVEEGLLLSTDGIISVASMAASHPSVCKFRNTAKATKHSMSAALDLYFAAGMGVGFCTPSEKFGVCLEGSVNFLHAGLTPAFTYTHFDLVDTAGRTARQSTLAFSVNTSLVLMSGGIDIRVVFGKWFSFTYNLFSFTGYTLPVGGEIYAVEWPMYEEMK